MPLPFDFLAENSIEKIELTFLGWMVQTIPFVIVALLYVWVMVCLLNRPEVKEITLSRKETGLTRKTGSSSWACLG